MPDKKIFASAAQAVTPEEKISVRRRSRNRQHDVAIDGTTDIVVQVLRWRLTDSATNVVVGVLQWRLLDWQETIHHMARHHIVAG